MHPLSLYFAALIISPVIYWAAKSHRTLSDQPWSFAIFQQVMVNKSMPTVTRDPLNPLEPGSKTPNDQYKDVPTCK